MNGILQALVVIGFLVASNVVAAGVILVLGLALKRVAPGLEASPWPWIVICGLGAAAAYLFLKGAVASAAERARLQFPVGRRGG